MALWAQHDFPVVAFDGMRHAIDRQVTFYITDEVTCVLHLALEPPPDTPARPVYRVLHPHTADDLRAQLAQLCPALCFTVSAKPAFGEDGAPLIPFSPGPFEANPAQN
jgi:hypothetical protein